MKIKFGCYVKIYTENFSDEMDGHNEHDEDEIVRFLLDDAGCAFGSAGNTLSGDLNIWYLGTNERHGFIYVNGIEMEWGWGGSSWENIERMLKEFKRVGMSKNNLKKLEDAYKEGVINFSFMYDIKDYLEAKEDGTPWTHPGMQGRNESIGFFRNAVQGISEQIGSKNITVPGTPGETIVTEK